METTAAEIIAQVLGPLYLVVALGLLTRPEPFLAMVGDMDMHPGQSVVWGMVALSLGLLILAFHDAWRADWTVVVTLIGWAATIKGVLLTLAPEMILGLSKGLFAKPGRIRLWAIGPLVLGAFLTAGGYGLI